MKWFNYLFLCLLSINLFAQKQTKPKLVVGIVVDQMRYDYLEKFYDDFGDNGFKKIIQNGSNFTNCHVNYIPTATGPGHASIYTGTTPYYHGIVANDWIDRDSGDLIYCTSQDKINKHSSPERMLSTTIGDQLKLSNNGKSKTISISIKDRASILPGGQSANAAYWYNTDNGKFITSKYYLDSSPNWVNHFNNSGKVESYLTKKWTLIKPIENYSELPSDNQPFETDVFYENRTSFPHSLENVPNKEKYKKLIRTPWGNKIIVDFVKKAVENEKLGKDKFTDLLAISFSSTDKIGHDYGPDSYEVKDTYLRLDKQIADLLFFLEKKIGRENFILFLTADHGVMHNIDYLKKIKINSGQLDKEVLYANLQNFCLQQFKSKKIIKAQFSRNIYLDYEEITKLSLNSEDVENSIKRFLLFNIPEINQVYTRTELEKMIASRTASNFLLNGFNSERSGDILYELKANHTPGTRKFGSDHGSRFEYDNHIPLIFYGSNIPSQTNNNKVFIIDIAPTITDLLGISQPSDCIGLPLLHLQ